MPKVRCRRCRKATKVIHDSYKVCVRCMGELGRMEYDLRLIEDRRRRVFERNQSPIYDKDIAQW